MVQPKPKGRRNFKDALTCVALSLALEESLEEMIIVKNMSNEKREEMREINKSELFNSFMELKAKELELKAKEVNIKVFIEEAWLMTTKVSIMDDVIRVLYEKKRDKIMSQDN